MDPRIPTSYQHYWQPFKTKGVLYHITTKDNLRTIKKDGLLPRDPNPKYWKGMRAVFMAYSKDPLYSISLKNVHAHVQQKSKQLVRLHVRTKNALYKSTDPERTFQVISLDPIPPSEILKIEYMRN